MIQIILTVIIVAATVIIIAWKIYKYFRYPEKSICRPEECASCPYSKKDECGDGKS